MSDIWRADVLDTGVVSKRPWRLPTFRMRKHRGIWLRRS
jgi:hypothetical protein